MRRRRCEPASAQLRALREDLLVTNYLIATARPPERIDLLQHAQLMRQIEQLRPNSVRSAP